MHRRYVIQFLALALALVAGFGFWGHQLEPLSGDLTRIGWRTENDFGWTVPKEHFEPLAAEVGTLDGSYDIVAIGDSFTGESQWHPGTTWPHYLARDTGLKVAIFDSDDDMLGRFIDSEGFKAHPPAVVIYEIVERNFITHHRSAPDDACPASVPDPTVALVPRKSTAAPLPYMRPRTRAWDDWPVTYTIAYAVNNLRRWVEGHETTNSVRVDLTRPGLFSSRVSEALLVYGEDFNKMAWTEADWRGAACDLLRMQARVEASGKTLFLAMVAPDKLTTYGPFLADPEFRNLSRLNLVAALPGLNFVSLGHVLDPTKEVDLYLPDDTHWSTTGHALAARQVEATLATHGALPRAAAEVEGIK